MMKAIYKFSKEGCPPCKLVAPVWTELKAKFGDNINFIEVSIDNEAGMKRAVELGIRAVPAFASSDGFRHTGVITKEQFEQKFLKNETGTGWMGSSGTDWSSGTIDMTDE
jgi:thiol-disulfide isomerase/thioredoxin